MAERYRLTEKLVRAADSRSKKYHLFDGDLPVPRGRTSLGPEGVLPALLGEGPPAEAHDRPLARMDGGRRARTRQGPSPRNRRRRRSDGATGGTAGRAADLRPDQPLHRAAPAASHHGTPRTRSRCSATLSSRSGRRDWWRHHTRRSHAASRGDCRGPGPAGKDVAKSRGKRKLKGPKPTPIRANRIGEVLRKRGVSRGLNGRFG